MANGRNRKVHFFKLLVEETTIDANGNVVCEPIVPADIVSILTAKITELKTSADNTKIKEMKLGDDSCLIEIYDFNRMEGTMFLKLSRANLNNTIALRKDDETYKSDNVEVGDDQHLETFTFLFVDWNTSIVSILFINGAPRISLFKKFIDSCLPSNHSVSLPAIINSDILEEIATNNNLTRIEVTVAAPNVDMLYKAGGFTVDEKNALVGDAKLTTSYVLKPEKRGKSITREANNNYVKRFLTKLFSLALDSGKDGKCIINAKGDDGYTETYNLMEYKITEETIIENIDSKTAEEFEKIVISAYEKNKRKLVSYLR